MRATGSVLVSVLSTVIVFPLVKYTSFLPAVYCSDPVEGVTIAESCILKVPPLTCTPPPLPVLQLVIVLEPCIMSVPPEFTYTPAPPMWLEGVAPFVSVMFSRVSSAYTSKTPDLPPAFYRIRSTHKVPPILYCFFKQPLLSIFHSSLPFGVTVNFL